MTNTPEPTCPKCNGYMVRGFLPDQSQGATFVATWYPGEPEKSFWTATKRDRSLGVPVGAFLCEKCGFLELYAGTSLAAR